MVLQEINQKKIHSTLRPHPIRYTQCTSKCGFLGQRFGSKMILEKLRISLIFKVFSRIIFGAKTKLKNTHFEVHWVYRTSFLLCFAALLCFSSKVQAQEKPPTYAMGLQKIIDRGVLKVALCKKDASPFFMMHNGKLKGLDTKHVRAIAKELGVRVVFNQKATSFNEVVDLVARGEADMAFSKLSFTLSRAKRVAYTKPYVILYKALMINRLNKAKEKNERKINTFRDLLNHPTSKILVIARSSYESFVKKLFPKAQIICLSNWLPDVWKGMSAPQTRVLAAARDDLEIRKLLRFFPEANLTVQSIFLTNQKDEIRAIVTPHNTDLLRFVNDYLGTQKIYKVNDLLAEYNDYFEENAPRLRTLTKAS